MEAIFYSITVIWALIFSTKVRINNKVFIIFWFSWALLLSLIIRNNGFDVDISVYVQNFSFSNTSMYLLREPIFWIGSRLVFLITQSPTFTLVIFDSISFVLIAIGLRSINAPRYYYFIMFILPYMFFGMQNIYRQYLAMCLIFMAYTISGSLFRKLFYSSISTLTHNASILLFPLVIFNKPKLLLIASIAVVFNVILMFVDVQKSGRTIGYDLSYIFAIFMVINLIAYVIFNKTPTHMPLFIFAPTFIIIACFILQSSQVERIGYYFLFIMIPILLTDIESRISTKSLFRVTVILVSTLFMTLFPATFNFI